MSFQKWGCIAVQQTLVAGLLFICPAAFSQPGNTFNLTKLKDSIQSIVNRDHVPGLMIGITTKDSLIFSGGFGYADIKAKRRTDDHTLFRLGSITKMFVSLAILQLVQQGKLSLNDELKKLVPELPFTNKWESAHPVRVINLLEHTAGFDDMKLNRMCSQDSVVYSAREMMLMQAHSLICRWKPGERFSYSNPGYVILGYIIEKISGKPYAQYIAENILLPLNMHETNFNAIGKMPARDTKQYVVHSGKIIEVPSVNCLMAPAGALWSSASDMVKFIRLFLASGQPVFPGIIIHEMETTHSSLAARSGLSSGYGLANASMFLYNKSADWRGHTGLMGTCFSTFSYNRQLGVGFIMSSNGNQQNGAIEKLIADYLEQQAPNKPLDTIATDPKLVAFFAGQYRFESPRVQTAALKDKLLNTHKVYIENNSLFVQSLTDGKMKLVQTVPGQFAHEYSNKPTIVFTKNEEGRPVMVMDGLYFEKASAFSMQFTNWLALITISLALSAALAGIISSIGFYTGRVKRDQFLLRLLPVWGLALLAWAIKSMLQVQTESYLLSELTTINARTIIIFAGTLLFGVFAVLHLVVVIRRFSQFTNRFFAVYWLLASLAVFFIAFLLFQNGWIGLRTWAM